MKLYKIKYGVGEPSIVKYVLADDDEAMNHHNEISIHFNRRIFHLATLNRIEPAPLIDLRKRK